MKTIKQGEKIRRVSDKDADSLVKNGWNFIAKKEWKDTVIVKVEVKENKSKKA